MSVQRSIIQDSKHGALLTIHVQPRASRTEYVGVYGDALKFRVASPPVEGAANEELCAYLAVQFGLSPRDVVIHSGKTGRRKLVLLRRLSAAQVRATLNIAS